MINQRTKRLAVVIGNSEYRKFPDLANPINDAKDVQIALDSLGFEVVFGHNLARNEIMGCFDKNFLYSWTHEATEIVIYYSGHGCSINGDMYLIPTDASAKLPAKDNYLELDTIINVLLQYRSDDKFPIIFILDCCRSEPERNEPCYKEEHSLKSFKGEIGANRNIAILYSTASGKVAPDGYGQSKHSPYTHILLEHIKKYWSINMIHREIAKSLKEFDKNNGQIPWIYESLYNPYTFNNQPASNQVENRFYGLPTENRDFVNRQEIFSKIEAYFSRGSEKPSLGCKILALTGIGGMGKTQLMLRYCYVHRAAYDFIFWLDIDGKTTAHNSFYELAINLGLDEKSASNDQADGSITGWVANWLQERTKWLLLLDNADEEMAHDIFRLLPRFGGDIIITTCEPVHRTKADVINVEKMNEDEALALLYGQDPIDRENPKFEHARKIVTELDSMPLAVNFARAHVHNMQTTFKEYLSKFKDQRDALLSQCDKDNIHQYHHSLAAAWQISFDRIRAEDSAAALILEACAFLQPELIPRIFFARQFSVLKCTSFLLKSKENESQERIARAIAVLVKFSFLSKDTENEEDPTCDTFKIHRLVQMVIYNSMNDEQKTRWFHNIATALFYEIDEINPFDPHTPMARNTMNIYLPHIRHFSTLIKDFDRDALISEDLQALLEKTVNYSLEYGIYIGVKELAEMSVNVSRIIHPHLSKLVANSLACLARFYNETKKYAEAEIFYKQTLEIMERLGSKPVEVAISLNNLALVCVEQGKFTDAEWRYKRALEICKNESADIYMATSLHNLATLYMKKKNYTDAEPLYKQALEIREKALGLEHKETTNIKNNMALLYQLWGKIDKVEKLYSQALENSQKTLGPKHPSTIVSLNNLALFYYEQGRYNEAKKLYRETLDSNETKFGPCHADTANSLYNLATIYYKLGRYNDAEPYYRRAHTIREKELGPENSETANSLHSLASVYHSQAKYADAEKLFEQAHMIRVKLGCEHQVTAASLNSLALLYQCQGKYAEAKSLYIQAQEIMNKLELGPEDLEMANSLTGLASLCKVQWKYADAESFYQKALKIREKKLGPEHPVTADSLSDLALLYDCQDKCTHAKPLHERVLGIRKRTLGDEHPDTAISISGLAFSYYSQKKYTDSEDLHNQALEIRKKKLGSEHPTTAVSLNDLASLYKAQGKYADAEQLYQQALEIREKTLGSEHPATATSLDDLASLYGAQKKYANAEPLYQRAIEIRRKILGLKHPETVASLKSLEILRRKKRFSFTLRPHRKTHVI